jgi:hypothetical protein
MRKGQAAMEFLMTYGWAILVVLAAIGALAYFGVLSPDRFLPSKCTVSGGWSCVEYRVDSDGPVLILQNNLGQDATVVNVSVTHKTGLTGQAIINDFDGAGTTNTLQVLNGEKFAFTCPSCGYNAPSAVANPANYTDPAADVSGKYRGVVSMAYIRYGETVVHFAGGEISGNVE